MSDTGGLGPRLARWAAEARADEAIAARARERWLRQQAGETSTLAGTLVDLAEQTATVTVTVNGGRTHRGAIAAVGPDVVTLIDTNGRGVHISTAAIEAVEITGCADAAGDRAADSEPGLAEVLADLAAERPAVTVSTHDQSWSGVLTAAGADVVTIRLDAPDRRAVLVPIAAIVDVIG